MDPLTLKARELVIVELRDGDPGPWYWDGLTWNGNREKAQKMERGRAEILVKQTRGQIALGLTRGLRDTCEIVEIEQPAPRPAQAFSARDVAEVCKALGGTVTMERVHHRRENH